MKNQAEIAERIRDRYVEKTPTKLEQMKALDKKAKRPVQIFSYIFGAVGALVLGTGMSLAMKVIGDAMLAGIGIGLVGIAMVSLAYPMYQKMVNGRRKKYAAQMIALADELV